MNRFLSAIGLLLMACTALPMSAAPAQAVVYCTTTGVPQGCVVRRPVARAAAVTAGVRAVGTPMNRGGPVNRVVDAEASFAEIPIAPLTLRGWDALGRPLLTKRAVHPCVAEQPFFDFTFSLV